MPKRARIGAEAYNAATLLALTDAYSPALEDGAPITASRRKADVVEDADEVLTYIERAALVFGAAAGDEVHECERKLSEAQARLAVATGALDTATAMLKGARERGALVEKWMTDIQAAEQVERPSDDELAAPVPSV